MSTKPSAVPTWASDATYTGGSEAGTNTKVEPSSGRKNEGWEPAAKPPAQEFNWWWNLVGLWCQYLNDGALSGTHSITGTLGVTGAVGLDSTLNVDGNLTANANVTVVGEFKHANMAMFIPGTEGIVIDPATDRHAPETDFEYPSDGRVGSIKVISGPRDVVFYVPLRQYDRIKDVSARVKSTAGTEDISVMDVLIIVDGTPTNIGTTSDVNSSASLHTLTPTVADTTINNANTCVMVCFTVEAGIHIHGLNITYDRPGP